MMTRFNLGKTLGVGAMIATLASSAAAEKYALLVGINTYADAEIPSLKGAAADARSVAKTLIEVDGFTKGNVHLLLSEQQPQPAAPANLPTSENISKEFDWLNSVVKPGDTVFFFFAGHGNEYDDQAYMVTYNSITQTPVAFENSALSAERIQKYLKPLASSCVLIAAYDMCRSPKSFVQKHQSRAIGIGFRMGELQERSVLVNGTPKRKPKLGVGTVSMFACHSGEFSWEIPSLGRGFFSKGLEAALKYGANDKGDLYVGDIVNFVDEWVPANVDALGLPEPQSPESKTSSSDVYHQIFATGLKPGIGNGSGAIAALPNGKLTSRLVPRDAEDEYLFAYQAGFKLYKRKRFRQAQVEFERALKAQRTAAVLRVLGDCRHFQRDTLGAQRFFQLSIAADPEYSPAYSDLGYLEEVKFGRHHSAEALYRKAVECDPGNPAPVNNMSRVLRQLKRFKEALEMCRKAVELDPNNGLFEANLALELHNQGMDDEAIAHARRAKKLGLRNHVVFKLLHIKS